VYIPGEPIVLTPDEAIDDLMHSDMDCLVLGDFIVQKNQACKAFAPGFTASPPEHTLSKLSFDQYQRYRMVADIVKCLRPRDSLRILDIGSGPCDISEFFPKDTLYRLDKGAVSGVNCIQGDAADIPFKDGYFDFVISCDCFEHIPAGQRETFLTEALRVSGEQVIIACPFAGAEVEAAEDAVNAFHTFLYGEPNHNLVEHQEARLPRLPELLAWCDERQLHTAAYDNGQLTTWIPFMMLNFYLEKHGYWATSRSLNPFYHTQLYAADHRAPAYRKVVVIGKKTFASADLHVSGQTPNADLACSLSDCLANSLRDDVDLLRTTYHDDYDKLPGVVKDCAEKESSLAELRQFLSKFLQSVPLPEDVVELLKVFIKPFGHFSATPLQFAEKEVSRDLGAAETVLKEYLRLRPANAEAWSDLGVVLCAKSEFAMARHALNNACLLEYPLAYRNLINLYLGAGKVTEARRLRNEALKKGFDRGLFSDILFLSPPEPCSLDDSAPVATPDPQDQPANVVTPGGNHTCAIKVQHGIRYDNCMTGHHYMPWLHQPEFLALYQRATEIEPALWHNLAVAPRAYILVKAVERAIGLGAGEFVECGVYHGGTALLTADVIRRHPNSHQPHFHLFDTFCGIPVEGLSSEELTLGRAHEFQDASFARTQENLRQYADLLNYYPGRVPESFRDFAPRPVSYLHIDIHTAGAHRDCLEFFLPLLMEGAIVLFDDYGSPGYGLCMQAVNDVLEAHGLPLPIALMTGQALYIHCSADRRAVNY